VQLAHRDCLDHFAVFGEEHLRHLVAEHVAQDNQERPHQTRGNRPPSGGAPGEAPCPCGVVVCEERLGGLLKHYRRAA
jgi:putative transposase